MGTRRSQIVSVAVEQVDKDKLTTLFRKSNGVDTLTRIHVSVWSNQKQATESKSMGIKKIKKKKNKGDPIKLYHMMIMMIVDGVIKTHTPICLIRTVIVVGPRYLLSQKYFSDFTPYDSP